MLSTSGEIEEDLHDKVTRLMVNFENIILELISERDISKAIIRILFCGSAVIIFNKENLVCLFQRHYGSIVDIKYVVQDESPISYNQGLKIAKWEYGFDDPFEIIFQRDLLEKKDEEQKFALRSIALTYIDSEIQRMNTITNIIQINPIFGPASFNVDEKLAFVIMPFSDDLSEIFKTIIKPTVESVELVCRRSDDYKTNKVIIQDIWKAICESRIVVADLTNLNPNVMYELGIAHTVGKETILIYQKSGETDIKFPFDLNHIRRIEYENTASGGLKLSRDLRETIESVLNPCVK